ncbi:hypothetical protein K450DRAFT_242924 [Umbelopsis ramanniana AG]|uniref:LysM domain-containing protein n=1 Tax=Umbelopsis ramanniana AG TaxID=1314678 RepID=A0AAD5E9H7_UMBRA|nr:uncharacterized protein K450DRAFT_242924 [Umbelopsis ramanniana AG]KAI8579369.1 hypothetical protein K450DRAFT_242924 [Umbelopsis ramanniana AG]
MKFAALVTVTALAAVVTASGPAAGCLQTYTIKDGDGCEGIAASFSLTPDAFYTMNPGLHHAGDHLCDNLDTGKPYCVCMTKPCAQQKVVSSVAPTSVVATSAVATAAVSTKAAVSSVATMASASASASMATMALPSGSAASNVSVSASGSAAGASTTAAKSAGEKVVSSAAMVALLAGAASVLAF